MTRGAFLQIGELDLQVDAEVLEELNDALYGSGFAVVTLPQVPEADSEASVWLVEVTTA